MPETKPRTFRLFSTALVAAVLLAGVLLKADRYAGPAAQPDFSVAESSLVGTLRAEGWHPAPASGPADPSYRALIFRHAQCARAVTVAVLGHTPGLAAHVRHHLGDVDLIQDGRTVAAFDVRSLQAANLAYAVSLRLGVATAPAPPLLAIAPPRDALASACPGVVFPGLADVFGAAETPSDAASPTTIAALLNGRRAL